MTQEELQDCSYFPNNPLLSAQLTSLLSHTFPSKSEYKADREEVLRPHLVRLQQSTQKHTHFLSLSVSLTHTRTCTDSGKVSPFPKYRNRDRLQLWQPGEKGNDWVRLEFVKSYCMKPRASVSHSFSFSVCVVIVRCVCIDTSVGEGITRSQGFSFLFPFLVCLPAFFLFLFLSAKLFTMVHKVEKD